MNQKSRLTLIENTHNQNLQNSLETKLNLNRGENTTYANSAKLSSELVLDFFRKESGGEEEHVREVRRRKRRRIFEEG